MSQDESLLPAQEAASDGEGDERPETNVVARLERREWMQLDSSFTSFAWEFHYRAHYTRELCGGRYLDVVVN